ncbi:MAG: hypothetical protein ABL959_09555 [Pyrinomonadaceae bacterium]
MALIDVTQLRERFDIDSDIKNERLDPHIGSASRRLRGWVGTTQYNAASSVTGNETTDAELVSDLKNAEAHLAMHFAIYGLNSPLSGKGVVATAMADEGREMRKYLSPKETAELATYYLELAREMAYPYLSESDDADIEIVPFVEDDEGEAVTISG